MGHKIYSFLLKPDYQVEVTFFSGDVKSYDLTLLVEAFPEYRSAISDRGSFEKAVLDRSKANICWPGGVSLDAETLWYDGTAAGMKIIGEPEVRFAAKLLEIRDKLCISQKELEKRSGIRQADISRIERAEANPSLRTMSRLMESMSRRLEFEAVVNDDSVPGYVSGPHTIAEIEEMPEGTRVELINGVLYDMAPPTFIHQMVISQIHSEISNYLQAKKGDCVVVESPIGVWFAADEKNFVEPDILIVCDRNKIKKQGIVGAPDFIIEVASPSDSKRDFTVKLNLYRDKGVREYWILDPSKKKLVTYGTDGLIMPEVHALEGMLGVQIYDGKLQIDLGRIGEIIDMYPD